MSESALVLGGGGPVGIAWEAGVLAGLADEGVWPAAFDLIVGTSAGSFVGAGVALGQTPAALAQEQIDLGRREQRGEGMPAMNFDPSAFAALYARQPLDQEPSLALRQEFGALSKTGAVVPVEMYLFVFEAFKDKSWPAPFAATAVEVETGAFKLLRAEDGAPLNRGIAASCSVPGIFPPIEINGRLYMDGGVRSMISIDAASGHKSVLALAVTTPLTGAAAAAMAPREAKAVEAAGGACAVITPDEEALKTFPPNLMDGRNRAAITEAGVAQGRREAKRLKGFFP